MKQEIQELVFCIGKHTTHAQRKTTLALCVCTVAVALALGACLRMTHKEELPQEDAQASQEVVRDELHMLLEDNHFEDAEGNALLFKDDVATYMHISVHLTNIRTSGTLTTDLLDDVETERPLTLVADTDVHDITISYISKERDDEGSYYKLRTNMFGEEREFIARMTVQVPTLEMKNLAEVCPDAVYRRTCKELPALVSELYPTATSVVYKDSLSISSDTVTMRFRVEKKKPVDIEVVYKSEDTPLTVTEVGGGLW